MRCPAIRTPNRDFTRLTSVSSKSCEITSGCRVLHFTLIYKTLKMSPAMAAGVSQTLWSISAILPDPLGPTMASVCSGST
jgi:hypothetical protein